MDVTEESGFVGRWTPAGMGAGRWGGRACRPLLSGGIDAT